MSRAHRKVCNKAILAIAGASGAVYGIRLMQELVKHCGMLSVIVSDCGKTVLRTELGIDLDGNVETAQKRLRELAKVDTVLFHDNHDMAAPPASGSAGYSPMIVAPCTMGTVARIAQGISSSLIERSADVMLKEGKKLILVPRETPLSAVHLENMLKLSRLGVGIIPAMPGFYHHPVSIDDMIDFVVGKVLDYAGMDHDLFDRWGEN